MSKKILVLDNSPATIEAVEKLVLDCLNVLGKEGVAVETVFCKSARRAIKEIEERQPDVVFLDYVFDSVLSTSYGSEVAKWIDDHYKKPVAVATHTTWPEPKKVFAMTKCVTHFVERDIKRFREFLEAAL